MHYVWWWFGTPTSLRPQYFEYCMLLTWNQREPLCAHTAYRKPSFHLHSPPIVILYIPKLKLIPMLHCQPPGSIGSETNAFKLKSGMVWYRSDMTGVLRFVWYNQAAMATKIQHIEVIYHCLRYISQATALPPTWLALSGSWFKDRPCIRYDIIRYRHLPIVVFEEWWRSIQIGRRHYTGKCVAW